MTVGAIKLCRIVTGCISPAISLDARSNKARTAMAVESWWAQAQIMHADSLVFYRMRGFPPWPGLVLPCKHRSYLQRPMNPLYQQVFNMLDSLQVSRACVR